MEKSRFSKYESDGKMESSHIANVNSFIDFLFSKGNDIIEKEIQSLTRHIENGTAPAIFYNKKELLINLGKCIEQVHETYHFNKSEAA